MGLKFKIQRWSFSFYPYPFSFILYPMIFLTIDYSELQ